MRIKFYLTLLWFIVGSRGSEFFGNLVNLNYCEVQKMFCKELNHVACFDEVHLRSTMTSNTPATCITTFTMAIKQERLRNGVPNLQWNRELESFAMLTPNNDTGRCAVSVKYLDTRFFMAKQNQFNSLTSFEFLDDNRVLSDPLATDIGCACKRIKGDKLVFCWYNYSNRITAVAYENTSSSVHRNTFTIIFYMIIFICVYMLTNKLFYVNR